MRAVCWITTAAYRLSVKNNQTRSSIGSDGFYSSVRRPRSPRRPALTRNPCRASLQFDLWSLVVQLLYTILPDAPYGHVLEQKVLVFEKASGERLRGVSDEIGSYTSILVSNHWSELQILFSDSMSEYGNRLHGGAVTRSTDSISSMQCIGKMEGMHTLCTSDHKWALASVGWRRASSPHSTWSLYCSSGERARGVKSASVCIQWTLGPCHECARHPFRVSEDERMRIDAILRGTTKQLPGLARKYICIWSELF